MSIEVTLKRITFKAGRSEQPGRVAEIVLMSDTPGDWKDLAADYSGQVVLVEIQGAQERLPFGDDDEPHENGTVLPTAGRRRRGTRANATEDE